MTEYRPRIFSSDAEISHLGERFLSRTLPKEEWTHEAHLATTAWLLLRRPDVDVDKELPGLIRCYNESAGGVNSDSEGYHDTITRAFLAGVRLFLSEADRTEPLHDATGRCASIRATGCCRSRRAAIPCRRTWRRSRRPSESLRSFSRGANFKSRS